VSHFHQRCPDSGYPQHKPCFFYVFAYPFATLSRFKNSTSLRGRQILTKPRPSEDNTPDTSSDAKRAGSHDECDSSLPDKAGLIGNALKSVYQEMVDEQIPEDFRNLLDQLD